MPISGEEFEAGSVDATGDDPIANDESGALETEKDLVTAFLSERPDRAFTAREIALGVDFSPVVDNAEPRGLLGATVAGFVDVAGEMAASAVVIDDVEEALTELTEEGIIEAKEVDTGNGMVTYYRLG